MEEERWLRQSIKDLESARDSLSSNHCEWSCFQAQQAAEKALKSFLYSKGLRAILTHSVRDLTMKCSEYHTDFETLVEEGKILDAFYISTRYPNGLVGESIPAEYYTEEDAEKCIKYAELILKTVRKFMKN